VDSSAIIRRLEQAGFVLDRVRGSHWTFKRPGHPTLITVPHPRKDLPKGLVRAIERDSGLTLAPRQHKRR
jgi:predicted RNA binding protein YcfA (HicA-like mRNA interferase family)